MTPQFIEGTIFEMLKVIFVVSMPVLMAALVVGLAISILQATTQIQEMTLAYIPKMMAIYGTLILFAGFIMDRLMGYTTHIMSDFTQFTR